MEVPKTLTRRAPVFLLGVSIALIVLPLTLLARTPPVLVYRSDFIPDGSRNHFNSFEAIPYGGPLYFAGSGPYVEDGIAVQQVNGFTGYIWLTYFHPDGNFGWYPDNGGGYTRITRPGGSDFFDVGFFYTTGLDVAQTYYELYKDGVLVLQGTWDVP
ncbi:MAG: hypothetical protein ACM3NQ_15885 [Bacteroidales bacterium]